MRDVVIIQPYATAYRLPLIKELENVLLSEKIATLLTIAGSPVAADKARGDEATSEWRKVPTLEIGLRHMTLAMKVVPPRAFSCDLLIVEHALKNLETYTLLASRTATQKRTAFWGHGATVTKTQTGLRKKAQAAMLRPVDWYFAYTPKSACRAAERGMPIRRTTVLFNTLDTAELSEMAYKQQRPEGKSPHTALYVGALEDSKRIDLLLEAAQHLRDRFPDFKLIVGGRGPAARKIRESNATYVEYRIKKFDVAHHALQSVWRCA